MTLTTSRPARSVPEDGTMTLRVTSIVKSGRDIRTFTFADGARGSGCADGVPLPGFVPGSHLVVQAGPYTNAYSLVSDAPRPPSIRSRFCASPTRGRLTLDAQPTTGGR